MLRESLVVVGDKWTEIFELDEVKGAMIHQEFRGMPCTYAISSRTCDKEDDDETRVTRFLNFDPCGEGSELWQKLQDNGILYENFVKRSSEKTSESFSNFLCILSFEKLFNSFKKLRV